MKEHLEKQLPLNSETDFDKFSRLIYLVGQEADGAGLCAFADSVCWFSDQNAISKIVVSEHDRLLETKSCNCNIVRFSISATHKACVSFYRLCILYTVEPR